MAKQQLTGWISGDLKPVRVGVYERDSWGQGSTIYSLWNGEFWCVGRGTVQAAEKMQHQRSYYQSHTWRGLLKETKA